MHYFSLTQPMQSIFSTASKQMHKRILLVIAGIGLLIAASKIEIPLPPVPVNLLTLAVFFIGMTYGWRLGIITFLSYVSLGMMGLPVFAGWEPGYVALMSQTGGYILGCIPALVLSGWLVERGWGKHMLTVLLAQLLGSVVIYSLGLLVLSQYFSWHLAVAMGLKPFLVTDTLKMVALSLVVPKFWSHRPS